MRLRQAWSLAAALWVVPGYLGARPEIHVLIATADTWPDGLEKALREASNRLKQSNLVLLSIPEKKVAPPSADAWLEEAEAALERLDLDAAQEAHTKALEAFSQSAKLTRPASELFLSRGLLFYAQGNTPAAKKELTAAAILDPTLLPDPVRYPPKLLKLYKQAQHEANKRSTARVEVTAPKESTLWVDGFLYTTPRLLPVGTHYLRVERAGYLPFVQRFILSSAGAHLTASLEEDLFAQDQARRALAAQDPSTALAWAHDQGIYELIVLAPSQEQWQLSWFDVTARKSLGQANTSRVHLQNDLLHLIEPTAALTLTPPQAPTPEVAPRWRSSVFWVPVGLGLLSGAVLLSRDLLDKQSGVQPSINLRGRP
jgi:tetratricopeptide (TPR) repeat protein